MKETLKKTRASMKNYMLVSFLLIINIDSLITAVIVSKEEESTISGNGTDTIFNTTQSSLPSSSKRKYVELITENNENDPFADPTMLR